LPIYTPDSTEICLAVGLILLLCGLIFRLPKLQLRSLPIGVSVGLFLMKCVLGFGYVMAFRQTLEGGDAYRFFYYSQYINASFHENPAFFFRLLLGANDTFVEPVLYKYAWQLGFWSTDDSYTMLRFNALLRCISGGYYALHVVAMSFFVYCANLLCYKIIHDLLEKKLLISFFTKEIAKKNFLYFTAFILFLLPSAAFFTSGVHKDGLAYCTMSVLVYHLYYLQKKESIFLIQTSRFALFYLVFFGFFLIRKYLLIVLVPSLGIAIWFILFQKTRTLNKVSQYVLQYFILISTYFLALYIADTSLNFYILNRIVAEQGHFIAESGGSDFYVPLLAANAKSLLAFAPYALLNGFLQPIILTKQGIGSLIMSAELLGVFIFLGGIFVFYRNYWAVFLKTPLVYFLITYIVGSNFLYGLMLSNAGSLVRYRSISLSLTVFLGAYLIALAQKNRAENPSKSE
jgi:hypothetical protein